MEEKQENFTREEPLIDPSLLEGLTEEQRKEALEAAAAAKRAEERAEQRALERALKRKEEERRREKQLEELKRRAVTSAAGSATGSILNGNISGENSNGNGKVVYVPKKKRGQQSALDNGGAGKLGDLNVQAHAKDLENRSTEKPNSSQRNISRTAQSSAHGNAQHTRALTEKELLSVKATYLGKAAVAPDDDLDKRKKQRTNKKITFKFRWDDTDDTFDDSDPLYAQMIPATLPINKKPKAVTTDVATLDTVQTKPLDKMTPRDWRIFRENFEINVRGGRAPPPLRSFRESPSPDIPPLHSSLLNAIENELKFKEPTPIQRQAIPIGMQRRDLIGIAETGSGKTVAFGVPLCQYLLNLPSHILSSVADSGPLALVMAPTRELALQIDVELAKLLSRQHTIRTAAIVGGQSIQHQAQALRKGVHIVVGTPGRINDCIEMAYLVLNQCSYICLDEADRMIDMGFAPQMESILDAMGGLMKSENEEEAYEQELADLKGTGVARHRLTVMFSATMPLEVEKLAKKYLRHPAIISIGDQDSGKNSRITQRVIFLSSPSQKENALRKEIMDPRFLREKIIVFVNEKKHADSVGRIVERAGRQCVVMHGGKSQEQREENLESFRKGGVVMVATDVAGRGLDIPDVAHVINYDLPTRSIENYTHRIGRTGRAGKVGWATSFITDEDEGIMAPLKAYLESTGNEVPERLAKHPAAASNVQGNVIY